MGSIISAMIKYSFYTSVLAVAGVGVISYNVKPEDNSFKNHLEDTIKDNAKPKTVGGAFATYVGSKVYSKALSSYDIKDFIFFKVATNHVLDNKHYFIGAFHNWFCLNPHIRS